MTCARSIMIIGSTDAKDPEPSQQEVLVMSKAHESLVEWEPEPKSPVMMRASFQEKKHWIDSRCVAVHWKQWNWATRDRCLSGDRFNRVAIKNRCQNCQAEFLES